MQKLEYWKKKIKGVDFADLPEFLIDKGFRQFGYGGSGNFQFKHTKRKVVIKHGYLCTRKPRKDVVPSIIIPIKNPSGLHSKRFKIVIQPLCEIRWAKIKKYSKDLDELYIRHPECDIGSNNIGIYRNKLVMIDW